MVTCHFGTANIFAGFLIRACWICAKYAKINVPQIFPLLQYFIWCPYGKVSMLYPLRDLTIRCFDSTLIFMEIFSTPHDPIKFF